MVYYNQAIGKEGGLLMDNEGLTQYTRIAISLAERIASGQLKEGDKLSGRSKLSPEYNVSPETIRRTLRRQGRPLLTDDDAIFRLYRQRRGPYRAAAPRR